MAPAAPIEFVQQAEGPGEQAIASDVDKAKQRAEKYGLPLDAQAIARTPGMLRDASRKQAALQKAEGVITGFDMYEDAEVERQQQRAARFGTAPPQAQIEVAQPSEEEAARKARAAKYGMDYQEPDPTGVDGELVLERRREAAPEAALRPEALHVYGVDLVGTRDLLNFFSAYGPTFVEWIDDSSCNVLFPDEFTVKRVLVQLGEAISDEEAASMAGIRPQDEAAQRLWYRAKSALMKQGVAVPLLFRVAFTSDAKDWMKQHKTRRLWQMPVRQAVAVAQGKAELPEAPQRHAQKRKSGQKAARETHDADGDGDAVMDGQPPRGRGGRKRHKLRSDGEFAADAPPAHARGGPHTFLSDNNREAGAHSFFLNNTEEGGDEMDTGAADDGAPVATARPSAAAPAATSHASDGTLVDLSKAAEGASPLREPQLGQRTDDSQAEDDVMEVG